MSTIRRGPLLIDPDRRRGVLDGEGPVVRLRRDEALDAVETLTVPASAETILGLNCLRSLRVLRYEGTADIFGFQETLDWLTERAADSDALLYRLATNMLAAPPIADTLAVILAPGMVRLGELACYRRLLEAIDDLAACSNGRQDSSRQNIILCRSYAQWKRFEYAQEAGLSLLSDDAPLFSPEERVVYLLALYQGSTYQTFYTADGAHGYANLRSRDAYLAYLRKHLTLTDNAALRDVLSRLLEAEVLTGETLQAAVALLSGRHLTEAAAFLLERGARRGGALADLDAEFAL